METIAVYFEPVAKSYGLETFTGLVMVRVPVGAGVGRPAGQASAGRFAFVMLQSEPGETSALTAVLRPEDLPEFRAGVGLPAVNGAGPAGMDSQPVEMVVFQGPHFYERCGIAAAALEALGTQDARVLLAGFSGSMAYLVVPAGAAQAATAALAKCLRLP
jgi:hypothetical protein